MIRTIEILLLDNFTAHSNISNLENVKYLDLRIGVCHSALVQGIIQNLKHFNCQFVQHRKSRESKYRFRCKLNAVEHVETDLTESILNCFYKAGYLRSHLLKTMLVHCAVRVLEDWQDFGHGVTREVFVNIDRNLATCHKLIETDIITRDE